MPCQYPGCLRKHRFERIAFYARKRYLEGFSTMQLMGDAKTDDERSQIALASLLDLDDDRIRELRPYCSKECQLLMFELRERLRMLIARPGSSPKPPRRKRAASPLPAPVFTITLVPG